MTTEERTSFEAAIEDLDSRCQLMLDVTCRTLQEDPELRLCEGLRLIDATRKAVLKLAPDSVAVFDADVLPLMRNILMKRFGLSELPSGRLN